MKRTIIAIAAAVVGLVAWACYQVATQPIEWDMEIEDLWINNAQH